MSRDDFISDHLVDMRERLKRNYDDIHRREGIKSRQEEGNARTPETTVDGVPRTRPVLPVLPVRGDVSGEYERDFRELEGRILHDLAAGGELRTRLQLREEALENYLRELEELRRAVSAAVTGGSSEKNTLVTLSARYFSASGRFAGGEASPILPAESGRSGAGVSLRPLVWAVIGGSVLVAAVLLILFL